MARFSSFLVFALIFALLPTTALAERLSGRTVKVLDGDTIDLLLVDKTTMRVRLAGIDAPEKGQAFSERSREHLAQLVASKVVSVEWSKRDRYNRIIGKVLVDGRDVCLDQVRSGFAWHFKRYEREQSSEDRSTYGAAEIRARSARIGLWADQSPVAPWDYRSNRKNKGGQR